MTSDGGAAGRARRGKTVKPMRDRTRTASSQRWLERQLNDPYVAEARRTGYRSRAAFKLIQLDDKFRLFRRGRRIVDLGAAPGGWTQVAVERTGAADPGGGCVVAVDLLAMDPIAGAELLRLDFLAETAEAAIKAAIKASLGGAADVVLSDMAAPATGHRDTDRLRAEVLAEAVVAFARDVLAPGGALVTKTFHGATAPELVALLKRDFAEVRHVKPAASRSGSAEIYLVATGFRG
ncbi:MAG: RlmE family RNA methyltransferase [Alphaproteobacteria bacterium]|nr:RlmE family RNA methyltransferase [Alphaproteobacteria bacterium]